MFTGTIIHVAEDKGYGFLVSKDRPFERIYFHWSGLIQDTLKFRQLRKGMKVLFDVIEQEGTLGLKAIDIEIVDEIDDAQSKPSPDNGLHSENS